MPPTPLPNSSTWIRNLQKVSAKEFSTKAGKHDIPVRLKIIDNVSTADEMAYQFTLSRKKIMTEEKVEFVMVPDPSKF